MTRQTAANLSQSWTSLFTAKSCFVSWFWGHVTAKSKTEKWLKNIYIFVAKGIPTWHGGEQTARGEGRCCCVVTLDGKLAAGWQ